MNFLCGNPRDIKKTIMLNNVDEIHNTLRDRKTNHLGKRFWDLRGKYLKQDWVALMSQPNSVICDFRFSNFYF